MTCCAGSRREELIMTWMKFTLGLAGLWVASTGALAQFPVNRSMPVALTAQQPEQKEKKDDKTAPPQVDFAVAPAETAEAPRRQSPHMMGDQGLYSLILVPVPALAKLQIGDGQTIDVPFTA